MVSTTYLEFLSLFTNLRGSRHGACFNACTGDIEDAPAFFGIHSFPAKVQDGKIHVTADPKYTKKDDNLVRQPNIPEKLNLQGSSGVVIVGGGSGALHAIESLREVCSSPGVIH